MGRDRFIAAPANRAALAALDGWRDWPGARLALSGQPGAGKTHLAHIWSVDAGARLLDAGALATAVPDPGDPRPLAIDGADTVAGRRPAEETLLHLLNLAAELGAPVLLTGRTPPARWPVTLPDLASRLAAIAHVAVNPADDMLLVGLYEKLFADRQLSVDPAVIAFLLSRARRDCAAAIDLVARIDAAALSERREVRLPLVRELLAQQDDSAD